eukprot:scaffold6226_cov117-Isochrysis_galbana.AAC.2
MPRQWVPSDSDREGEHQCNASAISGYNTMCPLSIASPLPKICQPAELHLVPDEVARPSNATNYHAVAGRAPHHGTSARGRVRNHTRNGTRWHGD